jgi:MinD-like ATPase involved in chromosome partitioning or flagellar assembly
MEIKTFRAASMQAALRLVRRELGPDAAVLRTREVRAGGVMGLLTGERGIEVEASAEVIVPSRLPRKQAPLDQGLDLTEITHLQLPVDRDAFDERSNNHRSVPFHVAVVGAAVGVGSTTVATNLAAALNAHRLRTLVWNAESNLTNHAAADVLLFDVGAGPTQTADRLWDIANLVLLVVTSEAKSILDGYAAIKQLAERRPGLRFQTVVNFARNEVEADRVHRQLAQTCRQFLNFDVEAAGFVPHDGNVPLAIQAGRSLVTQMPHSLAAQQFEQIASQLAIDLPINYLRFNSRKNLKFAESAVTTGRY